MSLTSEACLKLLTQLPYTFCGPTSRKRAALVVHTAPVVLAPDLAKTDDTARTRLLIHRIGHLAMAALSIGCLFVSAVQAAVILNTLQTSSGARETIIRVRSPETMVSALLRDAVTRSPTFRQLVDTINSTNGIVYVEHGTCRRGGLHACLLMSL